MFDDNNNTPQSIGSCQHGTPSLDELENIKLRPTLISFPAPRGGKSPPRYRFDKIPNIDDETMNNNDELDIAGEITCFEAISNSINYFIGVGLLGLPYGMKNTGWIGK